MQSDIPYPIRNSLGEMERLDLLYHTLFRITGRKNHVSLESVSRVLDIGAGTCAWMLVRLFSSVLPYQSDVMIY
jgi:hypothetical protein